MSKKELLEDKAREYTPMRVPEVMSCEEQRRLVSETYSHPYGVFIRLSLFSGLRPEELLGLQWDDIDDHGSRLRVRHEQRETADGFVLCSARFPRLVPLLPHVLNDLVDWKRTQEKAVASMPPYFWGCTSITLLLNSDLMDVGMLQNLFQAFLRESHLPEYPLCALRDTFAARALEQGMFPVNLCRVLGDASAVEIYGHFKGSRKEANRAVMETLLSTCPAYRMDDAFPVVVTMLEDGHVRLRAPNFPGICCVERDLNRGFARTREQIEEYLKQINVWPIPTPIGHIPCEQNEYIVLLAVLYK